MLSKRNELCLSLKVIFNELLPPATKLGQGYVFTRVCDSVHGKGSWYPTCIAGSIPHALQGLQGEGVVSQHALQRPTPRGEVEGSGWGGSTGPHPGVVEGSLGPHQGGLSRPTPGGVSRPTPRRGLLLRAVRILLECIPVYSTRSLLRPLCCKPPQHYDSCLKIFQYGLFSPLYQATSSFRPVSSAFYGSRKFEVLLYVRELHQDLFEIFVGKVSKCYLRTC